MPVRPSVAEDKARWKLGVPTAVHPRIFTTMSALTVTTAVCVARPPLPLIPV